MFSELPQLAIQSKSQVEKVLGSRVAKKTRHKACMEHLIKWKNMSDAEATWVFEIDFKKMDIDLVILFLDVTFYVFFFIGENGAGAPKCLDIKS